MTAVSENSVKHVTCKAKDREKVIKALVSVYFVYLHFNFFILLVDAAFKCGFCTWKGSHSPK
jgi:hypothetical protein